MISDKQIDEIETSPIFLGYDLAMYGEDYTCLTFSRFSRKGGDIKVLTFLYGNQAEVVAEALKERDQRIAELEARLKEAT